ncbi:MAG: hypothetical protein ACLFV8_04890, partial [Alphaproteobacteria bacterium]
DGRTELLETMQIARTIFFSIPFVIAFFVDGAVWSNTKGEQIYDVHEIFIQNPPIQQIIRVRGRINLHPDSEPNSFITMRDLSDPYGYTKDLDERLRKIREFREKNPGLEIGFPIIRVSPFSGLYGFLDVPGLYKVEEQLLPLMEKWSNECVLVTGVLVDHYAAGRFGKVASGELVPLNMQPCSPQGG